MSKCYIPEISIRTIRDNIIDELKDKFTFEQQIKKIICSSDGFYEIKENCITKFITVIKNEIIFEEISSNTELLSQFILDPLSLNLKTRVHTSDPLVPEFYKLSRIYCYIMDKTRLRLLKDLENNSQ